MKIEMDIWLHSDSETKKPIEWEIFSITGEELPIGLIAYVIDEGCGENNLDLFEGMETEEAYKIVVDANLAVEGWCLTRLESYEKISDYPEYPISCMSGSGDSFCTGYGGEKECDGKVFVCCQEKE